MQGPPGLPGKDGKDGQPGINGNNGAPGTNGKDGKDGVGLEPDLVRIDALSWTHNMPSPLIKIIRTDAAGVPLKDAAGNVVTSKGIVIGFNGGIKVSTVIAEKVFEVSAPHRGGQDNEEGYLCHCPIRGSVIPVSRIIGSPGLITNAEEIHQPVANAVAFIWEKLMPIHRLIEQGNIEDVWVRLRGDFVMDEKKRAIDAEFARGELPTGDRPGGSNFGIQGGLFESWFFPKQD